MIDADDDDRARFTPTPEHIAAECLAFQASWSVEERIHRRQGRPDYGGGVDATGVEAIARLELDFTLARRRATRAG